MGNLLAKPSLSLRNLLERNRQTARASKQQNYIMRFADCLHHPVCCLIVKTRGVRRKAVENNADSGRQPDSSLSLPLIWSGTKFCSTSKYFTKTSAVLWCSLQRMLSPHTTNSPISAGYPTIQFWYHLSGDRVKSHRFRPQSHRTVPTADASQKSGFSCHLCFWPSGYQSVVPTITFLSLLNFLEQLRELRETFYYITCVL